MLQNLLFRFQSVFSSTSTVVFSSLFGHSCSVIWLLAPSSNYRPVSLTSVSCKVLEHIVFRAIMDHVDLHKILKNFQHGFRAQHSCETQLITTIEDLAKGLNDKQQLNLLILDFSKAFDVVGHQRLLRKLSHYGIGLSTHPGTGVDGASGRGWKLADFLLKHV